MRKKWKPETEELREERRENDARRRNEEAAAEDNAIDALVKRSIKVYGP